MELDFEKDYKDKRIGRVGIKIEGEPVPNRADIADDAESGEFILHNGRLAVTGPETDVVYLDNGFAVFGFLGADDIHCDVEIVVRPLSPEEVAHRRAALKQ